MPQGNPASISEKAKKRDPGAPERFSRSELSR